MLVVTEFHHGLFATTEVDTAAINCDPDHSKTDSKTDDTKADDS